MKKYRYIAGLTIAELARSSGISQYLLKKAEWHGDILPQNPIKVEDDELFEVFCDRLRMHIRDRYNYAKLSKRIGCKNSQAISRFMRGDDLSPKVFSALVKEISGGFNVKP